MKLITVFDIQVWDGGDRHNHKLYVESEDAAKEWVKINHYDTYYKKEMMVYSDLEDYKENSPENLKNKALAKLTAEERKALGF